MPPLADAQNSFIETINKGPDHLHPALFDGPRERVILGLMAHANTISHARLVALEDTFPMTRQYLGVAPFNALTRDFAETSAAKACDSNQIGSTFPQFLADPVAAQLAQIEWAWLESYHAAEAPPVTLADLSVADEESLIAMPIAPHPSARIVSISVPIAPTLSELAGQQPAAILSVRPGADVILVPLDAVQVAVFAASGNNDATMGNLLAVAIELSGEQTALAPILNLVGTGALIKPDTL